MGSAEMAMSDVASMVAAITNIMMPHVKDLQQDGGLAFPLRTLNICEWQKC